MVEMRWVAADFQTVERSGSTVLKRYFVMNSLDWALAAFALQVTDRSAAYREEKAC